MKRTTSDTWKDEFYAYWFGTLDARLKDRGHATHSPEALAFSKVAAQGQLSPSWHPTPHAPGRTQWLSRFLELHPTVACMTPHSRQHVYEIWCAVAEEEIFRSMRFADALFPLLDDQPEP